MEDTAKINLPEKISNERKYSFVFYYEYEKNAKNTVK